MLCSRRLVQQWCFAVFLLCSPAPHHGRPIDALSGRTRRSVSHAQLMHDKGRVLQDFKRRMWLQELLDEVHTAEIRDLQIRTGGAGGGGAGGSSSGAGSAVGVPGVGIHPSTTGSTLHSKPAGGTKNLPLSFRQEEEEEEEEGTNLPQETNKAPRTSGKKKKKGRGGRRREGEKRRRRARSLGWRPEEEEAGSGRRLEWSSLLGLRRTPL
ncbi:parathyroid hormone-like hormone a [Salarias fasciatus]|uniref:Parathyroid hormone-related protein-like n=1 Tax=Salarias fasciatus TaxID=181472 RepID=A0A672FIS4_SALFA|nr:parathyroid hormone-related protein-like [Salarias fasciatus]